MFILRDFLKDMGRHLVHKSLSSESTLISVTSYYTGRISDLNRLFIANSRVDLVPVCPDRLKATVYQAIWAKPHQIQSPISNILTGLIGDRDQK